MIARASHRFVVVIGLAALATGCTIQVDSAGSEAGERERLQSAHDAALQLDVRGRIDVESLGSGVREATMWCKPDDAAVPVAVDARGAFAFRLHSLVAHDADALPVLHVVDNTGEHWWCPLALAGAPPAGSYELGEVRLAAEPKSQLVTDDHGAALPGARVLLCHEGRHGWLHTVTDRRGQAWWCRAAPFVGALRCVVRHDDFAPWWGPPCDRVVLDHGGGEIRGRVVVPLGVDANDLLVHVWVGEAAPGNTHGERIYADVTAMLASDGSFVLRNVPPGPRTVGVQDRLSGYWLPQHVANSADVLVGLEPVTVPDLVIETASERVCPSVAVRLRLMGPDGRPITARHAQVQVSDVVSRAPVRNGYLDWIIARDEPFHVRIPGYEVSEWRAYRSGETVVFRGGHRVHVRLDLASARRLPQSCTLRWTVRCDEPGFATDPIGYGAEEPAPYPWYGPDSVSLPIARDAHVLVPTPGRYSVELALVRWDASARRFDAFEVDVQPREFVVRAGSEATLVSCATHFVEER